MWELDCEESWAPKNNCGVGEDSWESLGLQGNLTSPFWRRWALGFLWREWCWSWNSSTLAISCEELTHWKRLWCWEGLAAGGEWDDRGWDGWMASLTRWMWVWVNSGSWWWTGRPGVLRFMGLQRVGHDWAPELNWTECKQCCVLNFKFHKFVVSHSWFLIKVQSQFSRERIVFLTNDAGTTEHPYVKTNKSTSYFAPYTKMCHILKMCHRPKCIKVLEGKRKSWPLGWVMS